MRMTAGEFEREKRWQGLMYFIRRMLRDGLITHDEFDLISGEYAAKFSPKTGGLLAKDDLLCV